MLKLLTANLALFGGEGAASGSNDGQGVAQPAAPARKEGKYDNVIFGKTTDSETAGVGEGSNEAPENTVLSPEERKKAYDEFVKANKDLYSQDFQQKFNRRHADYKNLQEKSVKADRLIELLSERYGESDIAKLEELISGDTRLLEEEAIEKGIPVEQLLQIKNLKRERDNERMARERIERERRGEEQYRAWLSEAQAVKLQYPDFELDNEVLDRNFVALLQSGVPMDHAYKVIHYNELLEDNVNKAMQKAAKATADNIAAKGNRPTENAGRGSNSGVVYKSDVSSLSKEDRAEIARRVAMGEKISF